MFSLPAAKLAVNIVSSIGIMKIVGDVIKNNTIVLTTAQKLTVNMGTFVLAGMLVDQGTKFVNEQIDQIIALRDSDDDETPGADDKSSGNTTTVLSQ